MLIVSSFAFGGPSWVEAQRINLEWIEPRTVESQDSFLIRLLTSIRATSDARVVRNELTNHYEVEIRGVGLKGGAEF